LFTAQLAVPELDADRPGRPADRRRVKIASFAAEVAVRSPKTRHNWRS
jgi:hypothetical protein